VVQRFTPLLADTARLRRPRPVIGGTSTKRMPRSPAGGAPSPARSTSTGQVIDVLASDRRDAAAGRRFFRRPIATLKVKPNEVVPTPPRSTARCSTSCCPRRGTTSSSMRTTRSRLTTGSSSNSSCVRCKGYTPMGQRRWSSPGMPSHRTFAACTTSSPRARPRYSASTNPATQRRPPACR
jgi:hypothetical protein